MYRQRRSPVETGLYPGTCEIANASFGICCETLARVASRPFSAAESVCPVPVGGPSLATVFPGPLTAYETRLVCSEAPEYNTYSL